MKKILYIIFFIMCGLTSSSQSVFNKKNPNVAVTVKLLHTSFTSTDSVKFLMTITNISGSSQKLLFDKPHDKYPWLTNVSLNRKDGQPVKVTSWAFLSSQLYTKEQLKDFYREVKPGGSITQIYYLTNIVRFDTKNGSLPKGTYSLRLNYDVNISNEVKFSIK